MTHIPVFFYSISGWTTLENLFQDEKFSDEPHIKATVLSNRSCCILGGMPYSGSTFFNWLNLQITKSRGV